MSSLAPILFAAFEQTPIAIVLLDPTGRVLGLNTAARPHLGGRSDADLVGTSIWESVGSDASGWWRRAVERAQDGHVEVRELDETPGGEGIVEWTIRPMRDAIGTLTLVAEGRQVAAQRQMERESQLLVQLALAMSHTDSLEIAIAAALRTVCEASGWRMAEAWLVDRASDVPHLVRGGVWTARDPKIESFASQGTGITFVRGEGLPGVAWERAEPVWERRLIAARDFTRAPLAATAGLKSAVAIPVLAGDDVVAVLSFYMADSRPDDARYVTITAAVAAQLGPLVVQKQAEDAHRVAEAKLGGIVSIALDAIISIDEARRITLFNWGAEHIFGYSADEMLGQPLDLLLPPSHRDRHSAHIAHFAASSQTARRMGERSPIMGLRKNGEVFPAEASISRFRAGGHWTFTVILRDITDRQRTEEGLRFLAETGALLSDLLRDPTALERVAQRAVPTLGDVCVIDLADETQIAMVAAATTDPALAEAIRDDRKRHPLTRESADPVVEVLRTGQTYLASREARPGQERGSLLIVPLVTQGRVLGAMTFTMARSGRDHDASYRTLAEQLAARVALAVDGRALYERTRQAVGARDEVLAVVSHDLRNPLSAINMCIGALRESPPPNQDTARELMGTVQESAALMSRIIQDLLDVASIDAGRLSMDRRPQPLAPIVTHAIAMFESVAAERDITLQQAASPSMPDVTIDADRVLQVMANLLHNACKFTPSGGTVRVATQVLPDAVQVTVSDTGCGIAREDVARVFDRFWHDGRKSKIRSTGLGLAIARGIVEAHGGRIWVESTSGQGSTFAFTLPVSR